MAMVGIFSAKAVARARLSSRSSNVSAKELMSASLEEVGLG